mmetsp:Transcript_3681/g.4081  ORF Transcript_3681/g.4081 Transcript_3681/m.4081 type:complete len:248 (-) Transcript_3681:58-801(-)
MGNFVEGEGQTGTNAEASGRAQLKISQGIVPPDDQSKFDELLQKTAFDQDQIQIIMESWGSKNYERGLEKDEFAKVAERLSLFEHASKDTITKEVLVDAFFDMFDQDKNGTVEFFEFVTAASLLTTGSLEDKAKLFFRTYDRNADGKIDKRELRLQAKKFFVSAKKMKQSQLKRMAKYTHDPMYDSYAETVDTSVDEAAVDKMVESAFLQADTNGNSCISEVEFVNWVKTDKNIRSLMVQLGFNITI